MEYRELYDGTHHEQKGKLFPLCCEFNKIFKCLKISIVKRRFLYTGQNLRLKFCYKKSKERAGWYPIINIYKLACDIASKIKSAIVKRLQQVPEAVCEVHRVTEHSELEGTHRDHHNPTRGPAKNSPKSRTMCLSVL